MRKVISITLVVMMLAIGVAYAANVGGLFSISPDRSLSSRVITYDGTGANTGISSNFTAGDRIIGFTYTSANASTGALYDANTLAEQTTTTVFAESSVAANSQETIWFPFPKTLTDGLSCVSTVTTAQSANFIVYYL